MTLQITSISDIDDSLVEQAHAELDQLMQEAHPEVELTRGVVHDLLQYFAAVFAAKNQQEVDRVTRAASLREIEKDPSLAEDEIVDRTLSNFLVDRQEGDTATGQITIVVSKDVSVTIAKGAIFEANGVQFTSDEAFVGRASGSILQSDTDRELTQLADGNWAFNIDVTATETGAAGNINKGTKTVPEALPNNFVDAFAAADFAGGFPTETNSELLTRLQEGIAAKTWGDRVNISALIKENFERVLQLSTIGLGDPEMDRDQHWIWPTSGGGRTDSYIRTRQLPQETVLTKEATLVDTVEQGGIWQFSITRDDAPGFYEVTSVLLPTASQDNTGFEITSDIRSTDLSADDNEFVPDVQTAQEGMFSRYQTAVIQFLDTQTPVSDKTVGSSTQDYSVSISAMPSIKDIQAFVNDRGNRPAAADNVVKAPVPCFLVVNFDLRVESDADTPDLDQIKNDLASKVNNSGFCGQLHASTLADVIHDSLEDKAAVGAIDMFGRIRSPDGKTRYIRDDAVIEIPDVPSAYVTGRTTVFILDPVNIGITVKTAGFPNI